MRSMVLLGVLVLAGVPRAWSAGGPAIVLLGKGVQIYGCTRTQAGYAWKLTAPEAVLTDADGRRIGHHFAGPSWQAEDGSTVTGEPMVTSQAPQAGAIPWLVLRARTHAGDGLFAGVSYIVRDATQGGVAPATGCDPAHADAQARVGYSATYTFFPG